MGLKTSLSLMCADLLHVGNVIDIFEREQIDYIHYDIMDGEFVNNISLGFVLFNQIRKKSDIKMDIHFLVKKPEKYLDLIELKNGDIVSVHVESDADFLSLSKYLHNKGVKFGLAINVNTPIDLLIPYLSYIDCILVMMILPGFAGAPLAANAMKRLAEIKEMIDLYDMNIIIEVDGHVCKDTVPKMIQNGAEIFVAGSSSVFNRPNDLSTSIRDFKDMLKGYSASKTVFK